MILNAKPTNHVYYIAPSKTKQKHENTNLVINLVAENLSKDLAAKLLY